MDTNIDLPMQSAPDYEQVFLDLLAKAQIRESELEEIYLDGHATQAQLAELEQLRVEIEESIDALDALGYFNPS